MFITRRYHTTTFEHTPNAIRSENRIYKYIDIVAANAVQNKVQRNVWIDSLARIQATARS